jgi:chromosome segregation ATPase
MAALDDAPEAVAILAALQARNRANAPACFLARAQETLLAEATALDATARTCERLQQEAAAAKAAEAQAADAARLMGDKLAEAQAKAADLEHALQQATARESALRAENETLLARLTEQARCRRTKSDLRLSRCVRRRPIRLSAFAAPDARDGDGHGA